ncbi:hypothetical protein G6F56_003254 [Rhizopus delemar]|uniref:C2 domain-containing protein n=1 Tax=Rhizopus stolonifer TaxID=4846 RepID=A0A367IWZ4_RHIST|nr:hypothetical protein G6F56_003254 [Rhizopus delemar]RCH82001.1 hypothetical protein CU098_003434 [Rhizopus stolonifer]
MLHQHSSASLSIHVSSASNLVAVQHFGKQDPYLRFSLDFNDKESFFKTFTHKNAGDYAVWNQTFTVSLNGEPDLFVEIMNEESTSDEIIGFAAIPINQIVHAQGAHMNGLFDVYDLKGVSAGTVNLQLAALGFPNSQPADFNNEPVRGHSYIHEAHAQGIKSHKKKATGIAIGGALLGGALAVGAGFLGKHLYDEHKEREEEEQREEEEKARLEQEEEERRNSERSEFDAERQRFEEEKRQYEEERRRREEEEQNREEEEEEHEHRHHHRRHSGSDEESDAERWNPVGTFAAGDRVSYHGQVYVCLQGHTSNPTWAPDVAHSLWQSE